MEKQDDKFVWEKGDVQVTLPKKKVKRKPKKHK